MLVPFSAASWGRPAPRGNRMVTRRTQIAAMAIVTTLAGYAVAGVPEPTVFLRYSGIAQRADARQIPVAVSEDCFAKAERCRLADCPREELEKLLFLAPDGAPVWITDSGGLKRKGPARPIPIRLADGREGFVSENSLVSQCSPTLFESVVDNINVCTEARLGGFAGGTCEPVPAWILPCIAANTKLERPIRDRAVRLQADARALEGLPKLPFKSLPTCELFTALRALPERSVVRIKSDEIFADRIVAEEAALRAAVAATEPANFAALSDEKLAKIEAGDALRARAAWLRCDGPADAAEVAEKLEAKASAIDSAIARERSCRALPSCVESRWGSIVVTTSKGGARLVEGAELSSRLYGGRLVVTRTGIYHDKDEVPVRRKDINDDTDFARDTLVTFRSGPPGMSPTAYIKKTPPQLSPAPADTTAIGHGARTASKK